MNTIVLTHRDFTKLVQGHTIYKDGVAIQFADIGFPLMLFELNNAIKNSSAPGQTVIEEGETRLITDTFVAGDELECVQASDELDLYVGQRCIVNVGDYSYRLHGKEYVIVDGVYHFYTDCFKKVEETPSE